MVNYVTRIIINIFEIQALELLIGGQPTASGVYAYGEGVSKKIQRISAMLEILATADFKIKCKNNLIYADSELLEAWQVKNLLTQHGFVATEYQIYVEYQRQWGVM